MDAIPYFYDSINRNAIVVKPKQPLLTWINSIYPESPVEAIEEGTVYLVRQRGSNQEIEKWLQRNFDDIFQNELNNWHTDDNDWPPKRTFKLFREWFDYVIYAMILDMEDDKVVKE